MKKGGFAFGNVGSDRRESTDVKCCVGVRMNPSVIRTMPDMMMRYPASTAVMEAGEALEGTL